MIKIIRLKQVKRYFKHISHVFSSANRPSLLALFLLLGLLGAIALTVFISKQQQVIRQQAASIGMHHYEYVFSDGSVFVYDMDNGHKLVKQTSLPTSDGVRGVVGNAAAHMLYISHGSDGDSGGSLLAYDLLTDKVVWDKTYSHGIDSIAITPDGKTIYMPDGETASSPYWYVINATDGSENGSKINGGPGPHNTVVSLHGTHVYMGARNFADSATSLTVADTATNGNVRNIGPFKSGIRPFTINSNETLAYVTTTGFLGFQVADIQSGQVLYTIDLTQLGFPNTPTGPSAPSHGIALSPDEKTVAVIDWPNDTIHLFVVTPLPSAAPNKIADIKFSRSMHHNEANCAYDCAADGWLEYSHDGRFLYVGDVGDVIDTATNKLATNIRTLYDTRKMLEVDFQNGTVSYVPNNRASIGYGATSGNASPTPSSPANTPVPSNPIPTFHFIEPGGCVSRVPTPTIINGGGTSSTTPTNMHLPKDTPMLLPSNQNPPPTKYAADWQSHSWRKQEWASRPTYQTHTTKVLQLYRANFRARLTPSYQFSLYFMDIR